LKNNIQARNDTEDRRSQIEGLIFIIEKFNFDNASEKNNCKFSLLDKINLINILYSLFEQSKNHVSKHPFWTHQVI
jgi:isocitrate/isopropylmalate dehydrogenase